MKSKLSVPGHAGELDISPSDLNALQKFFSNFTPGFVKDGIGILNDNAAFMRWKNFLKITNEAQEIRKRYDLEATPLPLKASVEYISAASLEEDPTMQTMWANLLANMTNGKENMNTIYVSILKELSPLEAKILNKFYLIIKSRNFRVASQCQLLRAGLLKEFGEDRIVTEIALDNLIRQRLIKNPEKRHASVPSTFGLSTVMVTPMSYSEAIGGSQDNRIKEETRRIFDYLKEDERNTAHAANMLELTSLGFSLIKACNEPEESKE